MITFLADNNPFVTDDMFLHLINELLLGMKDVHDAGIIHRDLHLGNIKKIILNSC